MKRIIRDIRDAGIHALWLLLWPFGALAFAILCLTQFSTHPLIAVFLCVLFGYIAGHRNLIIMADLCDYIEHKRRQLQAMRRPL